MLPIITTEFIKIEVLSVRFAVAHTGATTEFCKIKIDFVHFSTFFSQFELLRELKAFWELFFPFVIHSLLFFFFLNKDNFISISRALFWHRTTWRGRERAHQRTRKIPANRVIVCLLPPHPLQASPMSASFFMCSFAVVVAGRSTPPQKKKAARRKDTRKRRERAAIVHFKLFLLIETNPRAHESIVVIDISRVL